MFTDSQPNRMNSHSIRSSHNAAATKRPRFTRRCTRATPKATPMCPANMREQLHRSQLIGDAARLVRHLRAGVQCGLALDQHHVALLLGDGVMAYALRHDEAVALVQHDGAVLHFNRQRALEDVEELVLVVVAVPRERALHLGHLDVRVVEFRGDPSSVRPAAMRAGETTSGMTEPPAASLPCHAESGTSTPIASLTCRKSARGT